MYHLRLLTYYWEAEEIEVTAKRSYVDGMKKKWVSEKDTEIKGEVKEMETQAIYILMNREDASKHVKEILKKIRKEDPLRIIDFTFSKYESYGPDTEIYSGVL